jgi:hypothetical protein
MEVRLYNVSHTEHTNSLRSQKTEMFSVSPNGGHDSNCNYEVEVIIM